MLKQIKKKIQQRRERIRKEELKKKFVGRLKVGEKFGEHNNVRPPFR